MQMLQIYVEVQQLTLLHMKLCIAETYKSCFSIKQTSEEEVEKNGVFHTKARCVNRELVENIDVKTETEEKKMQNVLPLKRAVGTIPEKGLE